MKFESKLDIIKYTAQIIDIARKMKPLFFYLLNSFETLVGPFCNVLKNK